MRIGEALTIDIDDLDLSRDDEHVTVWDKGGRRRTVLLDDPVLVALLQRYLKVRGYQHGPLFRAEKNYIGGPLRYASAQQLWAKYREKAKVTATIHQLRHVHATELVNAGVSLETIRRRLGHANTPDSAPLRRPTRHHRRRGDPHLAAPKDHRTPEQLISHGFGRSPGPPPGEAQTPGVSSSRTCGYTPPPCQW
jgi:integrase